MKEKRRGGGQDSPEEWMERILAAILDDDRPKVGKLLEVEPGLATGLIQEPRLYEAVHWIYAGDTALHLAAAGYRVEIVRLLLEAEADPNSARNHRASRPLHYAADGNPTGTEWKPERQVKTMECLVEAGAEINAQDKNGASALHRAVRTRSAAAVKWLLERGADARLRNNPGSTPFHLAVQNTGRGGTGAEVAKTAQRRIICEFLEFGVTPALKDGQGKSVLESARSGWIREMLGEMGN